MKTGTTLARGLGLFSLGLGLAQVLDPHRFDAWIGVRPKRERVTATQLVGVRELGAAGGLLVDPKPTVWPWFRVLGDVMDIGLLARALASPDIRRDRVGMALASVVGITAVDLLAGMLVMSEHGPQGTATTTEHGTRRIRRAITVRTSRQQAYDLWRDFGNLPRFMRHLEDVQVRDSRRSHWRAKAPAGQTVAWDAEIIEDRPGEEIAWRSVEGSQIMNRGRVRFVDAPGDRGTEVHVELEYEPPFGPLGAIVAQLFGEEPAQQAADDLRRFKQILETGRVAWSEATVEDRRVRQRPAQPPAEPVRQPALAHA
jgi:uncharacterized membrane protein